MGNSLSLTLPLQSISSTGPQPTEPLLSGLMPHWGSGSVRFPPIFMGSLALCSNLSMSVCLSHKNPKAFGAGTGHLCFRGSWEPSALPWAPSRDSTTPA